MDPQLVTVAESQGKWSATANSLKKVRDRTRTLVFALSIAGALLAAISSQQEDGRLRMGLAIASAVFFAVVSFLTARLLDSTHTTAWVRARAASEALKREGYKYAAQAAPYDDPATRAAKLRTEAQSIEADIDDLDNVQSPTGSSSLPTSLITPSEYIASRMNSAIQWYQSRAADCQSSAKRLRQIEFGLALATTIITATAGVMKKESVSAHFDIVALTAVLTTLSATILAFVEASRYDFTVSSYRATARRLKNEQSNQPTSPQVATPDWSGFVDRCESIIQAENSSWAAKFGKP